MIKNSIKNEILTLITLLYVVLTFISLNILYDTYIQYKLHITIVMSLITAILYAV